MKVIGWVAGGAVALAAITAATMMSDPKKANSRKLKREVGKAVHNVNEMVSSVSHMLAKM